MRYRIFDFADSLKGCFFIAKKIPGGGGINAKSNRRSDEQNSGKG